jgi:hypothetical protein
MSRFFYVFTIILAFSLSFTSCQKREDQSVEKAVFDFILLCPGGSVEACNSGCRSQFGENVTTENFTAIDRCLNSCQNNCDLRNIFLLIEARN